MTSSKRVKKILRSQMPYSIRMMLLSTIKRAITVAQRKLLKMIRFLLKKVQILQIPTKNSIKRKRKKGADEKASPKKSQKARRMSLKKRLLVRKKRFLIMKMSIQIHVKKLKKRAHVPKKQKRRSQNRQRKMKFVQKMLAQQTTRSLKGINLVRLLRILLLQKILMMPPSWQNAFYIFRILHSRFMNSLRNAVVRF